MFRKATVEKAIAFTQFSVTLTYCWPLPSTATNTRLLCFKILRSMVLLNSLALLGPLLYAIQVHQGDAENVWKAACMTSAVVQTLLQTSVCVTRYGRFQRLIEEMKEACCEEASSDERRVFQRYVDEYSAFYGVSIIWFYLTAIAFISGTFFIADPFPTNAEYPFPVDFEPLRSLLFLHQAFVGMQCAAHTSMNTFCALLLFFSTARFEILMTELRAVKDSRSLITCIRKYDTVRRYAEEAVSAVRPLVLITITMCGVASVFCGMNFIGKQTFTVKIQFLFVAGTAFLQVFMCALPADRLMDMSESAMQGAYESEWPAQSVSMQKRVLLLLIPQPPVTLSIKCVVPVLSLNYYCSFISNVCSFFTALRIVMTNDQHGN